MKSNILYGERQVERRFEGELTLPIILRIWLKNHFKGDAKSVSPKQLYSSL